MAGKLRKFTAGELAGQFIKEIASGAFTRGDSAVGNAANIVTRRNNDVRRSSASLQGYGDAGKTYKNQKKS